jgi:hypothetical protein
MEIKTMATLKSNGATVFRARKGDTDWRVMSNGKVLRRINGRFKVRGRVKAGQTFRQLADTLRKSDWQIDQVSAAWFDLEPAPVKLFKGKFADGRTFVRGRNPGLLRAMANQRKTKGI